jgi:small subunit ribosomal protein S8
MRNDLISDGIVRIKNGYMAGLQSVLLCRSKIVGEILRVLKEGGFIESFSVVKERYFEVLLRYTKNGQGAIFDIKRKSKPGCRLYINTSELKRNITNRFGFKVLSTNMGVMNDFDAKKLKVGGEYLLEVL